MTSRVDVLAPCPGTVVAMSDVPDPVFAEEMVGPGVAIEPDPGPTTVVSPIAGTVVKVMPHAFVVLGDGVGVLVHLGIDTVKLGCTGPNQMKSFLRCGMGPCQGRLCGLTVTELIARERRVAPGEVGHYRLRFPTKPIPLGELAALPQTEDARQAVVRIGKAH